MTDRSFSGWQIKGIERIGGIAAAAQFKKMQGQ
jgi:hypothetical protein